MLTHSHAQNSAHAPRPAEDAPAFIRVYKTVDDRELTLHFFEPAPAAPGQKRPGMLLIHSGGWVKNGPTQYYRIARTMRDMGFMVACLEYRLALPPSTVADAVADAQDGMRYLQAHADELNLERERLVACGGSAGAHLAAGLALFGDAKTSAKPDPAGFPAALILFNPVIDTSAEGYGQKRIGEGWRELSPLHQVHAQVPPTIIFHGTADKTTPFAGAAAFQKAMQQHGNRCELHPYEGGDHGYYRDEPVYSQIMETTRSFCVDLQILPSQQAPE